MSAKTVMKENYQDFFATSVLNKSHEIPLENFQPIENQIQTPSNKPISLPNSIENTNEIIEQTKAIGLNMTIEENSMKCQLKDVEYKISHQILQLNQFNFNYEYLTGFLLKNDRNLDEENRICENMIGYLQQEIGELKNLVGITEQRLLKFEEKRKKSIKKA